jgi:hypothetical protein
MGYNPMSDIRVLRRVTYGVIAYVVLERLNSLIAGGFLSIIVIAVFGGVMYAVLVLLLGSINTTEVVEFSPRSGGDVVRIPSWRQTTII